MQEKNRRVSMENLIIFGLDLFWYQKFWKIIHLSCSPWKVRSYPALLMGDSSNISTVYEIIFHSSLYISVWVRLNKESIAKWKFSDRWISDRRHWSTGSWSLAGRTSSRSWSQMLSHETCFLQSYILFVIFVLSLLICFSLAFCFL